MHISELNLTRTCLYDVTQNTSQNLSAMKPYITGEPPPHPYQPTNSLPTPLQSSAVRAAQLLYSDCAPVCLACCGVGFNAWRRE